MKIFRLLLVIALISLMSCEKTELTIEDQANRTSQINTQTRANFTGKIKRIRIKRKRTGDGIYRVSAAIENDTNNVVTSVNATINPQRGLSINPENFDLEVGETNENGVTTFRFPELTFEGENPDGLLIATEVVMMNAEGSALGSPEFMYVTIDNNDEVDFNKTTLHINPDNTFYAEARIKGALKDEVKSLTAFFSTNLEAPQLFEAETQLEFIEDTEGNRPYALFRSITQENPTFVSVAGAANNIVSSMIASDSNGTEMDSAEILTPVKVNNGIKMKPRNPGVIFYPSSTKLRLTVSGENREEVTSITAYLNNENFAAPAVTLEVTGGNNNKLFFDYTDDQGIFDDLNDGESDSINLVYVLSGSFGDVIETGQTNINTVVDNGISIAKPKLKINENGDTFSLKVVVRGENKDEITQLVVRLTPEDGGSETEDEEYLIEMTNQNENRNIFLIETIKFIDSLNVEGLNYTVFLKYINPEGVWEFIEELDSVGCGSTDHF